MSTTVTFNGSTYTIPAIADASWGTNVANYLIAISTGTLQKTGGAFTLSAADVDFGATYGLKSVYFKSKTANIAAAGVVQLAKTDVMSWRNNANGADLPLGIDGSDNLTFNSLVLINSSGSQTLTNKLLSDSTVKFANVSDTTKLLMFSLGGATTGKTLTIISSHTNNRSVTIPDGTDTFQMLAAVQSPTNKTFDNTNVMTIKVLNFTLQDGSDTTKQVQFNAASIATGTTRTITVPDVSGTLLLLAATQSPTNKTFDSTSTMTGVRMASFTPDGSHTLTAPGVTDTLVALAAAQSPTNKTFDNTNILTIKVLNFTLQDGSDTTKQARFIASGISTGTIRSFTFPDASDTLAVIATQQTFTNKVLSDSTVKFGNVSDTTKALVFSLGGATTAKTMTLLSSHTNDRTITFPDATDTLMGKATTDIMTNKTATALQITGGSYVNYLAQAAARFNDSSTNYVALKAPSSVTTYTVTWPAAVPSANQVLADAGAGDGVMAWVSAASSSLNQYNTDIGNASNSRTGTNTNLLGSTKATSQSSTVTITIAAPGVVSYTSHGLSAADKIYITTTGALPTGLSASTTYFVVAIDANTFSLATSEANALAGTKITTSGSQSGTHTLFAGGLNPQLATSTQRGIVSATTQAFAGQKQFTNGYYGNTPTTFQGSIGSIASGNGGSPTSWTTGTSDSSYFTSQSAAGGGANSSTGTLTITFSRVGYYMAIDQHRSNYTGASTVNIEGVTFAGTCTILGRASFSNTTYAVTDVNDSNSFEATCIFNITSAGQTLTVNPTSSGTSPAQTHTLNDYITIIPL